MSQSLPPDSSPAANAGAESAQIPETASRPSAETAKQDSISSSQQSRGESSSAFRGIWLLLAIASVVLGVLGWPWLSGWLQQHGLHPVDSRQQMLEERLKAWDSRLVSLEGALQAVQDAQSQLLNQQEQLANQVSGMASSQRLQLLANEMDALHFLAEQRLSLVGDAAGALRLVNAVDEIAASIADARLLPVRQALAEEREALRVAANVDVAGILLRLDRLQALLLENLDAGAPRHVGKSTVQTVQEAVQQTAQKDEPVAPATGWAAVLARLQPYISVRYVDDEVAGLLSQERQGVLQESLQLLVARLQLAVLQQNHTLFEQGMTQLQQWQRLLPEALVQQQFTPLLQEIRDMARRHNLPALTRGREALNALQVELARTAQHESAGVAP